MSSMCSPVMYVREPWPFLMPLTLNNELNTLVRISLCVKALAVIQLFSLVAANKLALIKTHNSIVSIFFSLLHSA